MFRPAALTLLAVLAATPAIAEKVGEGACQPHRNGEVRCAVRVDIPGGNRVYNVLIHANRTGAQARMTTDTYISTCGAPGRMLGRSNIGNSSSSRVATFTNERSQAGMVTQTLFGFCVETFILDCAAAGQPVSCQQVLNLGTTKIEVN